MILYNIRMNSVLNPILKQQLVVYFSLNF